MNANHEKQSELQRMLAIKKHEAPPQPFFKGFSESVIDRLQKPETPPEQTWKERLEALMESKPFLVSLTAIIVFGCLAVGLVVSLRMIPPHVDKASATDDGTLIVAPAPGAVHPAVQPAQAGNRNVLPAMDSSAVVSDSFPVDRTRLPTARLAAPTATEGAPK